MTTTTKAKGTSAPKKVQPNRLYILKTPRSNFTHIHYWEVRAHNAKTGVIASSHDQYSTELEAIRNAIEVFGPSLTIKDFLTLDVELRIKQLIHREYRKYFANGGWA